MLTPNCQVFGSGAGSLSSLLTPLKWRELPLDSGARACPGIGRH